MATPSWQLSRRSFLRGSGIALGLPWLEAMSADKGEAPRRFCSIYFPYGAYLSKTDSSIRQWSWLPHNSGKDYDFTESSQSLEPLREQLTFVRGLSHPRCRSMGGHDTADTFLTGQQLKAPDFANGVSVDQVMAEGIGNRTRFASMVLSTDGGIGQLTRSHTLSYTRKGYPIPALANPRQIFERMFVMKPGQVQAQRRRLENSGSALDLLLDHSKSLAAKLGHADRQKLDEYLYSVRAIETRLDSAKLWLDVPMPSVDANALNFEASVNAPQDYIRCMYDLIHLAFQTDICRVASYQIGSMNGVTSVAGQFPALLGLGQMHKIAHAAFKNDESGITQAKWDRFLFQQTAYFINKLAESQEGDESLLERTIVLYGTSNSRTHNNTNYPLLLAGGKSLGLALGQSLQYGKEVPMANLLLTLLQAIAPSESSFADSTGTLPELLV